MQLTKKIESEVRKVYDSWMNSYLNGDVSTYDSYFSDDYHFIGSTNNEEFLNRKDTTRFFKDTAAQFSGKTDLRKEVTIIETFNDLIFITHVFDAWFLNGTKWTYYSRFRFSSVMQEKKQGWRFIYQHFSIADSKTEEGETIGFDKVNTENQELREAIKRRTIELEAKNRELEIEGALDRIRAQAVAMQQSTDLLDIVVTMRHEFTKLGHQANYFWHMMWLPEIYEKAMTSGDGNKIGFVMKLPRYMHGEIPLLAKWEKSKKPTVVYAMNTEEAIDYVDKMIKLGDFQNIDPQAPTHNDIRHIGGLTFIMARTTHGEIGYSLPGIIKNPPAEDLDILVQFASAFDLAHRRFLDLQKAEKQTREIQIELSLERIRSRVTAMKESSDLFNIVVAMRKEFISLGHEADYFWHMQWLPDNYEMSMTSEDGSRVGMVITIPKFVHDNIATLATWEKGNDPICVLALNAKEAWDYIDQMNTHGQYKQADPNAPTEEDIHHIGGITFIIARTTHGEIGYSLPGVVDNPPKAALNILLRFAGAFDLAHKRFEDLKRSEQQARETQVELALEKVRSRTMAMEHSDELQETSFLLDEQVRGLGIETWGCAFHIYGEQDSTEWFGNKAGVLHTYTVPREGIFKYYYQKGQEGESILIKEFAENECIAHYNYMSTLPVIGDVLKTLKKTNDGFPTYQMDHVVYFKYGYLLFITRAPVPEAHDIFKRFAQVFEQTYTRFLDLKKAEAQTREAQIEAALEKVRSRSLAVHKSDEFNEVVSIVFEKLKELQIPATAVGIAINIEGSKDLNSFVCGENEDGLVITNYRLPYFNNKISKDLHNALKKRLGFYVGRYSNKVKNFFYKYVLEHTDEFSHLPEDILNMIFESPSYTISMVTAKHSMFNINDFEGKELSTNDIDILKRFTKVFDQAYIRFLDLKKAEAQAREAQIEAALERVRSRAMAIRSSIELDQVIQTIFQELENLEINLTECSIVAYDTNQKDLIFWSAGPIGSAQPSSVKLQYIDHPLLENLFMDFKNGIKYRSGVLSGKVLKTWWQRVFTETDFRHAPKEFIDSWKKVKSICYSQFAMTHGFLEFLGESPLPEDKVEILKRFTNVVDLTYTRYDDVVKAEAQTRIAQISLAVERVRAKALAMHKSEEIIEVVAKLKDEVMSLDIPDVIAATIFLNEGDDKVRMWDLSSIEKNEEGYQTYLDITFKLKKKDPHLYIKRVWENPENYFVEIQEEKDFKRIIAWLRENNKTQVADEIQDYTEKIKLERLYHAIKKLNNGKLAVDLLNPPSDEMESILTKMGAAFDLAYKRFEDLKKAEAQTREAQIEAALEKVRSRSLAMHKPEELQEVVGVVAEKLQELGVIYDAGGVILCTYFPDNKDVVHWISVDDFTTSGRYFVPYFDNPIFNDAWDSKMKGDAYFTKSFPVEVKNDFFKQAFENSDYKQMPDDYKQFVLNADSHHLSAAWSKNSAIIIPSLTGYVPSESDAEILKRFAKVFEQAYIRFMDLQKSEAQAREAQIEHALEKVRSRTMAMQHSKELPEAANNLFLQVQELGIPAWSAGYCIWEDDKKSASCNMSSEGKIQKGFSLPTIGEGYNFYDPYKKGKEFHVAELGGKQLVKHYDFMKTLPNVGDILEELEKSGLSLPTFQIFHIVYLKFGYVMFITYEAVPEAHDIFRRFGKVFNQTYTRFLDLERAEAQTREAQIEMALEKVRSRTLAMQTSEELADTSVIVFKQLLELGIAPNRLFIGIINDDANGIEAWATNEDGSRIDQHFKLYTSKNKSIKKIVDGWKQKLKTTIIDMHGKELQNYFHYLNKVMHIPFIDGLEQTRRVQSIAYFSRGLIGMAAPKEQPKETLELLERFAAVFNLTYTRFKDLKIAEANAEKAEQDLIKLQAAKKSAEEALSELQATQRQLIQSEKMASLGELTAGIAHEIQNPLNFVNNFSDVSKELLDEMQVEMETGDLEEARAIMADVIQNLEKINHHGKRADGIVKGMLQHSRASGDKKEPTDINALADEYLRLAYHGLRAKDKSFNANLVTDFDETIGTILVIPQDIGRVILNLLTNAFYVVNEKKKLGIKNYDPTVSLSSKKKKNSITISVKDNGNGMPEVIKEKIFQPFFTTKPTGQGTGLGLSMSYDIITKGHNGNLTVESQEGNGTLFSIILPLKSH